MPRFSYFFYHRDTETPRVFVAAWTPPDVIASEESVNADQFGGLAGEALMIDHFGRERWLQPCWHKR